MKGNAPSHLSEKEYLTANEAAQFLGVSPVTVWRYVNNSNLPFHKPKNGRAFYIKSELIKWLENN